MPKPSDKNPLKHLRTSDLRGVVQLAAQATDGVSRIAEGVHQSVWSSLGVRGKSPGQTGGLTGLVYGSVRGVAQLLGKGADTVLAKLQPLLEAADSGKPETFEREAVLAALNGVMGDRLAAGGNPLATPMSLRHQGQTLDLRAPLPAASAKVLLMIHGLCMNDLQWQTRRDGQTLDHGQVLAAALGQTPLYLRYNTGLHVSQNGLALAQQLEHLADHWPVALEGLSVLAHSMGGLVIRSAVHQAQVQGMRWPGHLKHIVFLGTPHHGAPLEQAGNWVDVLLGSSSYARPFARLAQLRSAGITDLRHGLLLAGDWAGRDRFKRQADPREPVPLPAGVACHAMAATTAARRSPLADRLIGDGLVPLQSALGQHKEARHRLHFAKTSQWITFRMNHMELLCQPAVTEQVLRWMA